MPEIPACYAPGQVLTLQVGADQEAFNVVIEKTHGTWTSSVTLLVKVLENDAGMEVDGQTLFLKLYDRRYAYAFRNRWDVEPWTPQVEDKLLQFSQFGLARQVLDHWRDNETTEYDFNAPPYHKEAVLSEIMAKDFERESEAYSILREYQGNLIPKIITTVTMQIGPAGVIGDEPISLLEDPEILGYSPEMFEVNGFLFEYIRGFEAGEIPFQSDPGDWEHLKRRCVSAVGQVMNSKVILHEDVRPKNIVISPDARYIRKFRVVMTDFRSVLIRHEESDDQWAAMKRRYDEAGEIRAKLDRPVRRRRRNERPVDYDGFAASAWWLFDDRILNSQ